MTRFRLVVSASVIGALAIACSTNGTNTCSTPGGPVSGSADAHCGATVQSTSPTSCHPPLPDAGIDAGGDGGAPSGDYGDTLFGSSGDEDDCKYHVSWTSTPVCEGSGGVTFTVVATNKSDGSPLTGAGINAEVFLSVIHPSSTPIVKSTEGPAGTYVTQPVKFDAPGQWTVRFHFFEECEDTLEDSPHGHVAFYVSVP